MGLYFSAIFRTQTEKTIRRSESIPACGGWNAFQKRNLTSSFFW